MGFSLPAGFTPWSGVFDGPVRGPDLASSRPGVWPVGDVAGSPALVPALRDGEKVALAVAAALGQPGGGLDVMVVGAGPAGVAAALTLQRRGFRVELADRDEPFRTLRAFPPGKVLYADARGGAVPEGFAFDEAPASEVVTRWSKLLEESGLIVHRGVSVEDIKGPAGSLHLEGRRSEGPWETTARAVILAVGKRANPRPLEVPGGDLPFVSDQLGDPGRYRGQRALVVGGGDSAVEAALALGDAGAHVTYAHRSPRLDRPSQRNLQRLREAGARVVVVPASTVQAITPEGAVTLAGPNGNTILQVDAVFALLGADPPFELLRRLGVQLRSDWPWDRVARWVGFAAFVWCFYLLKSGRHWFPFHDGGLGFVHDWLTVSLPWYPTADGTVRTLNAGFWGTVIYTGVIATLGLRKYMKVRLEDQRRKYLSLIAFQVVFLFGIPEIVAPLITAHPSGAYALSVPWPLSLWSLAQEPSAWGWALVGALTSFVAIPLYVRRNGERFCSWMCGCGGLAETLGDSFRWLAPRGDGARKAENAGLLVLAAAVLVTAMLIDDAWRLVGHHRWLDATITVEGQEIRVEQPEAIAAGQFHVTRAVREGDELVVELQRREADGSDTDRAWLGPVVGPGGTVWGRGEGQGRYRLPLKADGALNLDATSSPLSSATNFARVWYALVVDFALASVLGVALYPVLGNRIWCRFFCPLRAYMELLARRFGRKAIVADDRCIRCGQCTEHCQMGIDVMGFAEKQQTLDNGNSACIQCGVCVEVCPLDVLRLVDKIDEGIPDGLRRPVGPRWGV